MKEVQAEDWQVRSRAPEATITFGCMEIRTGDLLCGTMPNAAVDSNFPRAHRDPEYVAGAGEMRVT